MCKIQFNSVNLQCILITLIIPKPAGGRFNIKMSSYQYRDPHVKDKMVLHLLKYLFQLD